MQNSSLIIRSSSRLLSFFVALLAILGGQNIGRSETCPLVLNAVDYAYYYSENRFSPNDVFIAGQSYSLEYRSFVGFHVPTLGRQVVAAELWLSGQILIFGD